ncbi:MAG: hypothetical protein FJ399_18925, partial [Verrucomicrobia bacterium]|nr:hypothetical protein [Verrucomicrobiota bacterium]
MQAHLARGDGEAAGKVFAALPEPTGPGAAQEKVVREWLGRLIEAMRHPAEAPQLALVEFLRGRLWTMRMLRESIVAVRRAGRLETARDAIDVALRAYPAHKWLQAQAGEVQQELAARAPAAPVAAAAASAPGGPEEMFMRRLDHLVRAKEWNELAKHIAQAEEAAPAP